MQMPVLNCYFCENSIWHKHKRSKDQKIFDKSNMWKNTIIITFNCITTRKAAKLIKNKIYAVD